MKKTGLKGYVHDFSIDFDAIAVSDTLEIHKYLMKKNEIVWKYLYLWSELLFQQWYFLVVIYRV